MYGFDGPPRKAESKQEDFYSGSFKESTQSFRIPDIDEIPISIPAIRSILAECNVGSLHSIQSAPPASIEIFENVQISGACESPKRPTSMVLEAEIPLIKTNALHHPGYAASEIDEDDNENLLTVSSVTARPLIAKSQEIQRKKKKKHDKLQKYQEVCPDGGYGWVIVFGAFSVLFWVTGLVKSYGVLYVEIMETYPSSSASLASWIPAILSSLCLALAPISSALCEKFSCRIVVFVGGLFCAAGLMLSYFATSLIHLLFSFGILTGIGGGLSTTPGIILVSRYFDKRRALANGICISGTAAGSFMFPILIERLVRSYGFHGTILILGGCMLHVCLSAMLYRPINFDSPNFKSSSETNLSYKGYGEITISEENQNKKGLEWLFNATPTVKTIEEEKPSLIHQSSIDSDEDKDVLDELHLKAIHPMRCSGILHSVEDLSTDSTCYFRSRASISSSHRGSSRRRKEITNDDIIIKIPVLENNGIGLTKDDNSLTITSGRGLSKSMTITTPNPNVAEFIKTENYRNQRTCCGKIKKYIDITLLKEFRFILMGLTVTLMSTGSPYMLYFLPAFIIDSGYSKQDAGYLVAITAVLDLTGRLGFGYLSDLQLFDRKKAYVLFIFSAGVCVLLIPTVNTWILICCASGCYGLFLGCWYLLIPVLLADLFGVERIGSSYALIRLFQSITAITVSPVAGYLRDVYGSYEICFYTMGICMTIGSLPLLIIIFEEKQKTEPVENEKAIK